MPFCAQCGHNLGAVAAKFCPSCGKETKTNAGGGVDSSSLDTSYLNKAGQGGRSEYAFVC